MPSKNNRRFERQRHNSVLEIYDESGKSIAWTAQLVNFSMGGASFSTTKLLDTGTHIRARIRILTKGVMEISGKVVWGRKKTNSNLYGIKFDSIK
ncbi:MAG TPA: hypothetical protein DCG50_01475, partial [Elusimicrobia bacterium]|nr:hypothetical protein [Elusimicrobiota bacterium]